MVFKTGFCLTVQLVSNLRPLISRGLKKIYDDCEIREMTVVSMKEMDVAFILTWSMLNVEFPQEESNLQTAVCFSHDSFIYLFFFFDKIINIITIITNLLFNLSVKDCMRKQLMRFLFFFSTF